MDLLVIIIVVFIAVAFLSIGLFFLFGDRAEAREKKRIRQELSALSRDTYDRVIDITRRRQPLSDIPWLNEILSRMPLAYRGHRLLVQADLKVSIGYFMLLSLLIAMVALLFVQLLSSSMALALIAAVCAGLAPSGYALFLKNRRMKKFEAQLPDALNLMAKALKAGHAFSSGLYMVSQEFSNPLGGEFEKVNHEINAGVSLEGTLINLLDRVDCPDLKFFSVSLILQKETGGNLAEILESISKLIRERFKLEGKIRSLAAEGKLSIYILSAIPVFSPCCLP